MTDAETRLWQHLRARQILGFKPTFSIRPSFLM
ncbi:MAG: hypothetical protein Q8J66_08555 [Methylotenera sp.]|nr:hypothetical protein [Methylotenera sp.]